MPQANLRERLSAKQVPCSEVACECDCLRWDGTLDKDGYGRIIVNGRRVGVHRASWELEVGPVPPGLVIDHVKDRGCAHKDCSKIEHLDL